MYNLRQRERFTAFFSLVEKMIIQRSHDVCIHEMNPSQHILISIVAKSLKVCPFPFALYCNNTMFQLYFCHHLSDNNIYLSAYVC